MDVRPRGIEIEWVFCFLFVFLFCCVGQTFHLSFTLAEQQHQAADPPCTRHLINWEGHSHTCIPVSTTTNSWWCMIEVHQRSTVSRLARAWDGSKSAQLDNASRHFSRLFTTWNRWSSCRRLWPHWPSCSNISWWCAGGRKRQTPSRMTIGVHSHQTWESQQQQDQNKDEALKQWKVGTGNLYFVFEVRKKSNKKVYFNGTNLEEEVAPIPGLPCLTGL